MEARAGHVQNGHAGRDGSLRGELWDEDQAESGRRAKAATGARRGSGGGASVDRSAPGKLRRVALNSRRSGMTWNAVGYLREGVGIEIAKIAKIGNRRN